MCVCVCVFVMMDGDLTPISTNQNEPESTRIPPPAHVPTKDKDI
jgi:hypothetical protein